MDVVDKLERTASMYAGLPGREEMAALLQGGEGQKALTAFRAFRVFDEGGAVGGRVVSATLDELSEGAVVIKAACSSVNYKDALAGDRQGQDHPPFPSIGGIDVAGTVVSTPTRVQGGRQVLVTGYDLGVSHDGGYARTSACRPTRSCRFPPG